MPMRQIPKTIFIMLLIMFIAFYLTHHKAQAHEFIIPTSSNRTVQGEEEAEDDYYSDDEIPKNEGEFEKWWNEFESRFKYPLYCVILASESDLEVVSLVQNQHLELAQISGQDCCFIYFRELEKAKNLSPRQYSEHAKWVHPIARLLGIDYSRMPCFLFFERITSNKYLLIELKGLSQQETIYLTREIFDYLRNHHQANPFVILKMFKWSKSVTVARKTIQKNITDMGREIVAELLKSLVKIS